MKNKIIAILFATMLIAANSDNIKNSRQPASFNQMNQAIDATRTPFPINDMYNVRNKVKESQNQYQKAREAQYKNSQMYNDLLK